jgi:ribosome maturation factor RimP
VEWAFCPLFSFGETDSGITVTSEAHLERVRAAAERVARSSGLDIFDVQFRRESGGWVLRVVIDRPLRRAEDGTVLADSPAEAIGIHECERVSTDLNAILDVEDVLDREYTLEVSSPGLDRPLRHPDDYRRFVGRLVKLLVPGGVDGQTHCEGRIQAVDDDWVVLAVGRNKEKRVPLGEVTKARLEVEF